LVSLVLVRPCKAVERGLVGNQLFKQVTELTGLPEELIGEELKVLLERKGIAPDQVTIESLREALADYLAQVALDAVDPKEGERSH
jgi:hypothetical protein